jgi:ParB-like chromosome segregation protein Spo0J
VTTLPLAEIVVKGRARKDMGDIDALAASIVEIGLLSPVAVNSRKELVAGGRRLAAVRKLGWTRVPVQYVASADDAAVALKAEREENVCREPLKPTELVELGQRIKALEGPKAEARMLSGQPSGCGNLPQGPAGKVRDKVAEAVGVSPRTWDKMEAVAEAAEEEPETFGDLPAVMDQVSVHAAHERLVARRNPAHFRPGNHSDPNHQYAAILNQFTALSAAITRALNAEPHEKIRAYLGALGFVAYEGRVIQDGEVTRKGGAKFDAAKAFRGLRRIVRQAGMPGKLWTAEKVKAEYEREEDEE